MISKGLTDDAFSLYGTTPLKSFDHPLMRVSSNSILVTLIFYRIENFGGAQFFGVKDAAIL